MRPRRRTRLSVSLFPFLSVLACVIGALVLVITATATQQVAAGGIDLEHYERLEQQIQTDRRRLAELQDLGAELASLDSQLSDAHARVDALESERSAVRTALSQHAPQREALRQQEARVTRLEQELAPLTKEAAAREQALAEKKRVLARAKIRIQPSGSGYGLEPHFVECRPEGIVFYEGLERRPVPVATHRIPTSAEFRRFLRAAVYRSNASVIFLIRPGGVDACEWARAEVLQQQLRYGEIPLPGSGELDFSALGGA